MASTGGQQRLWQSKPTARDGRKSPPLAHRAPAIEQQWRVSFSEELAAPLMVACVENMNVARVRDACEEDREEEEGEICHQHHYDDEQQDLQFAPAPTELVTCSAGANIGARCRRPCAGRRRRRQPLDFDSNNGNECDCRQEDEQQITTLTTTTTTITTNHGKDLDLDLGKELEEKIKGAKKNMLPLKDEDDTDCEIANHHPNHYKHNRHRRPQLCPQLPRHWLLLAQLTLIYILLTVTSSSNLSHNKTMAQATNYWPLRTMGRHRRPEVSSSVGASQVMRPLQQKSQSQIEDEQLKVKSGQLMIGQHYTNFSSIIPYSIVQDADYGLGTPMGSSGGLSEPEDQLIEEQVNGHQYPQQHQQEAHSGAQSRALLSPLGLAAAASSAAASVASASASSSDSNRLILPQMQQIKSRFNQGCVGGTKCQFFAFCWMSGGSLGASCGLLMTCCVTPSRQEIQPGFYGPVVNDPYCGRSTSKINRIVGGTDASFGQFPWQAFVQVGGSRCGGALISSRHVVTAGHCVARSQHSPASIKVTLGDYILNSDIESIPHEVFSVVEVLLHPNFRFTPQADRYDVAVLELDRQANYKDNIKPICLPQKDAAFVGRMAYVAGWGALQAGSKLRPKVLQHVAVPVIENHVCESWHRRKGIDIRIYDEMMCAGYELGQRDACQGDSGGPLMLNQFGVWYLVGIVSAGYSCAKQYQPGIYHRVSSSSDWISSNIYQQGANK